MSKTRKRILNGDMAIARVVSVDTEARTCDLVFEGAYGNSKAVPYSIHPGGGVCPSVDDMVLLFDRPGGGKRICQILYPIEGLTDDQVSVSPVTPGRNLSMNEGEAKIGGFGFAHFDDKGNSRMQSESARSGIELKYDTAKVETYGQNFDHYTQGKNVRIRTTRPSTAMWGDTLWLEVNNPSISSIDPYPEVPSNTLGRFVISNTGSINADVLVTPTLNSLNLKMDVLGNVSLGRLTGPITLTPVPTPGVPLTPVRTSPPLGAGFKLDSLDNVELLNPYGSIKIDKSGNVNIRGYTNSATSGSISLSNPLASISISGLDGSISLTNQSVFSVTSPSTVFSGSITFSAAGGSSATAAGPFSLTTPGFSINSANTSFSGNTSINGNTAVSGNISIGGALTVVGAASVTGDITLLGKINMPGAVFTPVPFAAASYRAAIPVFVNGIFAGIIPVI